MNATVGFDFDHTLGTDGGLERRAFGMLAKRLGAPIPADDPAYHASLEELLVPFRRGDEPMETMVARFVTTLPLPAPPPGGSPAALAEAYRDICFALADALPQPIDGALAAIGALVTLGVPVAILTNGWSPLQEKKIARALGAFPGPILVSDVIGAYKPVPRAFHKLAEAFGTPPERVWYVGDNPATDIAGAHAAGLRAVWFDRDGGAYPDGLAAPDARITSLTELVDLVRGA